MRYWKDSIQISEQEDLPILRTVYRAAHVTPPQLREFLYPLALTGNYTNTFNWRIRRLVRHRFLERVHAVGLGPVLSLGENGEVYLQGKEPTIVERGSRSRGVKSRNQLWHDTELFGIHLALRRARIVQTWEYETEIRAQNDFTTFGYRKDYDAIATFALSGKTARVALEYERTAKSSPEYRRICAELNRETRVTVFLYLTPSVQMQNFLLHALRDASHATFVTVAPKFCTDPCEAELVDVRTARSACLDTCLSAAAVGT